MNFGMITWNQNIEKKQNCITWIQTVFTVYIKTEEINVQIAKDVKRRFDISNYELDGPLLKRKNEKVIG